MHAAHILVRVPPVGGSEAENKAKAKIEDVLKRARAGEDFAKLAKEMSEDTANAPQGGDLGFVEAGRSGPAVRAGGLRPQEGRARPGAGSHAVRLSRHQGARREGGRQDAVQGRRRQDQGQARGGARRGGGEHEGGGRIRPSCSRPRISPPRRAPSASIRGRPPSGAASPSPASGAIPRLEEAVFSVSDRRHVRADQGADRVRHRQGRRSSPGRGAAPRGDQGPRDRRDQARARRGHRDGSRQGPRGGAGQGRRLPDDGQGRRLRDRRDAAVFRAEPPKEARLPGGGPRRGAADGDRARCPSP